MSIAALFDFLKGYLSMRPRGSDPRRPEMSASGHNLGDAPGGYQAYGVALTTWAMFERSVDIALWNAISGKIEVAACVTEQLQSIRSKLIVFENIAEDRGATTRQLKALRVFRNSIEGVTRERNRLIHDPHRPDGMDVIATRIKLTANDEFVEERLTASQLLGFASRVNEKTSEWYDLYPAILIAVGVGHQAERSHSFASPSALFVFRNLHVKRRHFVFSGIATVSPASPYTIATAP